MAENFVKGFQTDKGVELYDYNALGNLPTLITQEQLEAVQAAANKYTDDEIAKLDLNGAGSGETTPIPSQTNPFNITTIISTGQDFSELTESGIYQIYKAAAENSQNCPTTNGGVLTVKARQNETNPILQYMIDTTGKTYTRYKTSTSWSTWKEYVITSSLNEYTKKNELEAQVEQSLLEALEQIKQDGAFKGEPGDDYILTEADKNEIAAIAADLIDIPESGGSTTIELDTTLKVSGKAADAKSVGDALDNKLGTDQLQSAINTALVQAKDSGEFNGDKGEPGDNYILTDNDKEEIATIAANKVEVTKEQTDCIITSNLRPPFVPWGQANIIFSVVDGSLLDVWNKVNNEQESKILFRYLGENDGDLFNYFITASYIEHFGYQQFSRYLRFVFIGQEEIITLFSENSDVVNNRITSYTITPILNKQGIIDLITDSFTNVAEVGA